MNLSSEWSYIKTISQKRLNNNKTPRHVDRYGEYIEVIGVAGELVARRFLGLPEVLHEKFDGGVDLTFRGKRFDVKATKLTPYTDKRHLQWPHWKRLKADYVLMTAVNVETKNATVLGFVRADEIKKAPINRDRYTPCHEIPIPKLHPAWRLLV